jgi:hypothetical protein
MQRTAGMGGGRRLVQKLGNLEKLSMFFFPNSNKSEGSETDWKGIIIIIII